MNNPFEVAMSALFARLQACASVTFTANATGGSAALASVSSFAGLFEGLPVFGPGIARGASIVSIDEEADAIMLSAPVGAAGTDATFSTGFLTTGRRVKHWSQVSAQPALFLRRGGTTDSYSGEMPIVTPEAEIWIYSKAGADPDAIPDVALSNLDWLVRQTFAPDDETRFTIGGLVYWCRVEGRSDYSPGDQGGQGISRLPVRITLYPDSLVG